MNEMKSLTLNNTKYDGFVDPVARALASASAVIKSASGESIAVSDSSHGKPYTLKIYGRTTQDGVPTPDAPVELVSVGNSGSITVNVTGDNESQSVTVATPNGLPGIPVASGGNYTDANGQQWICDEIDLARGVYVRRVHLKTINGSEGWKVTENASGVKLFFHYDNDAGDIIERNGLSSIGYTPYSTIDIGGYGLTYAYQFRLRLENMNPDNNTLEELKVYLADNPIDVLVSRETPIETPLSEEEIAAYAALYTYRDHTTVTNDASAHMELEYVMDAKKYIDSLLSASVVRLSYVTIKASDWLTEAESLHSQVVTMDGITPYSKVDLLPSAEQLAIFHNKDVAFVTENEDGVVTIYAIGDKPMNDYTMQVQITEVTV
jgi:hypothetical protein